MSKEAVKIIKSITNKTKNNMSINPIMQGSVISVKPLTIKLDNVSFDISENLLINKDISKLEVNDRIAVLLITYSCYLILCKVVEPE